MNKKIFVLPLLSIFLIRFISAHCPLCTIGAGAAAGAAVWLGVSKVAVALFIGGFAMSMGIWFSKIPKKKYIPFQKTLIILAIFLTTVLPLSPIFKAIGPLYLSFIGEYGTTYAINYSLVSGLFGGTVVLLSPSEFEKVIQNEGVFLLNVHTPFQGEINGTDEIIEDWENIEKYMNKLPKDTSVPIAVYCRSGRMSETVAEDLKAMGYQKIYDLDGGMNAWEESGRKII